MHKERKFGPIYFIPGKNNGFYPYCNSLYVEGPGLMIDPAPGREAVLQFQQKYGIEIACLSHWHEDHFRNLNLLRDCPLWVSEADARPLADWDSYLRCYGVAGTEGDAIRDESRRRAETEFHFQPMTPDRILCDGEVIDLGSEIMHVIATPGHSYGHLAFYFERQALLFMGDYTLSSNGPWYGDPYADLEQTIQSIRRLREIPARVWIMGHGPGVFTEIPEGRWDRYLRVMEARDERLLDFLRTPRTMTEILEAWIIFGRPEKPLPEHFLVEKAHMEKHLMRLINAGHVLRRGDYFNTF
jgi:hydroxyacylglutathione hydrolase